MVLPAVCCRVACLEVPTSVSHHIRALATISSTVPSSSVLWSKGAEERHGASSTTNVRWLPGAVVASTAAAVMGVVVSMAGGSSSARADAPSTSIFPSAVASGDEDMEQAVALGKLREWLTNQGADLSKIEIKPSQAGPGAGLGIFSTTAFSAPRPGTPWWSWLWPHRGGQSAGRSADAAAHREPTTLASFPLEAAITVRACCNDPQVGAQFSWMLDKSLLDERTAVMVYMLIERLRGNKSRFAPWISALPTTFDVPVAFSERELGELRGTALHKATAAMSKRLHETWSRLEAPLGAVARELGLAPPRWEDWVWAYCVFWSRGQSLPVPESGSASSALVGHSSSSGSGVKIPIQILEGLVPGLDFCNHRLQPAPQCWWEVVAPERPARSQSRPFAGPGTPTAASSNSDAAGPTVRLQLHAGTAVRPGQELYISYGDKSNEELLMLYGFALPDNPHDHLMLFCPLPPRAEWDDVMYARVELLQAYGLRPQFFLPHPDRVSFVASSDAASTKRKKGCSKPSGSSKAGDAGSGSTRWTASEAAAEDPDDAAAAAAPPLELPGDVLDTLEVFVLNFQELAVRSKALQAKMEERRAARAAGVPMGAMSQHSPVLDLASLRGRHHRMSWAELRHYLQALGLRMATLTTFIRLLEVKVIELEGEEGTGSLEQDEQLLRCMDAAPQPAAATATGVNQQMQGQQKQGQGQDDGGRRERRLRAALVYRMGQKRLARAWLVRAKAELQNLLGLMRDMQARQDALARAQKQETPGRAH